LPVLILKSHSPNPAPDPLVYLAGGPGAAAIAGGHFYQLADLLERRDLIVFDQRGTGYAEPLLDCLEVDALYERPDLYDDLEETSRLFSEARQACRQRLVDAGINLSAYNTAQNAADVNDLRLALGYEQWNLYGGSYGTRLALTVMRDFSQGVRSVILDSTVPLQVDQQAASGPNTQHAFQRVFQACAADAVCNAAFPGLESAFYELVERLNAEPAVVKTFYHRTNKYEDMPLNDHYLIKGLSGYLFKPYAFVETPKLIFDAHQGRYARLAEVVSENWSIGTITNEGMFYSVMCHDEFAFTSQAKIAAANADIHPLIGQTALEQAETMLAICETWDTGQADPIENEAVRSDIPTLVLAGTYDPVTPAEWGKMVAETLVRAHYVEFPGGHGVLGPAIGCSLEIASAFLDNPSGALDLSCLDSKLKPRFITR
jgi:pimeloyl-ACP methyl ester carboxylesterase